MQQQDATRANLFPFEVALEHATLSVPIARPQDTIGALRQSLIGRRYDTVSHVAVCEGERFVGLLRVEELIEANAQQSVASVMDPDPPTAAPGLDQEIAAWRAVRHGEAALPVVDREGRFRGMIPPHRLLAVLLAEHDEDMSRLGGFLNDSSMARLASTEPVRRRFRHRIPWLLLGLAGAVAAADVVGWFEGQLQQKLVLAFFIPGIVYLADAVGTQTETVLVRGLSVGVPVGRIAARELLAGVAIGAALALVAGPVLYWRWGDGEVASIVAAAVFAACAVATLVAMTLPWVFSRFGLDPAFGSGPLATVIQDLLSLIIYFSIALAVI